MLTKAPGFLWGVISVCPQFLSHGGRAASVLFGAEPSVGLVPKQWCAHDDHNQSHDLGHRNRLSFPNASVPWCIDRIMAGAWGTWFRRSVWGHVRLWLRGSFFDPALCSVSGQACVWPSRGPLSCIGVALWVHMRLRFCDFLGKKIYPVYQRKQNTKMTWKRDLRDWTTSREYHYRMSSANESETCDSMNVPQYRTSEKIDLKGNKWQTKYSAK